MSDLTVSAKGGVSKASDFRSATEHSGKELSELTFKLIKNEVGFIFNKEFDSLSYEELELELDSCELFKFQEAEQIRLTEVPPYFTDLFSKPLLTAMGERALFRKFNYLKYWSNVFRSELDPESPSSELIAEIQGCLSQAGKVRNQIAESNLRLVVSIARKFSSNQKQFEELVSEGNLILIKAIDSFDYARGYRFSTYLTHAVQRHYYRYLQRTQRRATLVRTVDSVFIEETQNEASGNHLEQTELQATALLEKMHYCLNEREQYIVREKFGFCNDQKGRTNQSLSDELGVCRERVRQILEVALKKLHSLAIEMKLDSAF